MTEFKNGMVIMTEGEFDALNENKREANQKLHEAELTIQELCNIILELTRNKETKTEDTKLSMRSFLKLYNSCFNVDEKGNDHMQSDLYGHDVCVHWHGFYCNCYDGPLASNYIIDNVKNVMEEYDE